MAGMFRVYDTWSYKSRGWRCGMGSDLKGVYIPSEEVWNLSWRWLVSRATAELNLNSWNRITREIVDQQRGYYSNLGE